MPDPNREPSPGWVTMTCANHPTFRWTRKDPRIPRISGNPQLMFKGDEATGKWGVTRNDLPGMTQEEFDKTELAKEAVLECECPFERLRYVDPNVEIDMAHTYALWINESPHKIEETRQKDIEHTLNVLAHLGE